MSRCVTLRICGRKFAATPEAAKGLAAMLSMSSASAFSGRVIPAYASRFGSDIVECDAPSSTTPDVSRSKQEETMEDRVQEAMELAQRVADETYPAYSADSVKEEAAARDMRAVVVRELMPGILVSGALLQLAAAVDRLRAAAAEHVDKEPR